jgi:LPXTG-motif cell wall-anchored protein
VNLFKSPLRRTTAVVAGAFIGLVGAAAAAAPASAHAPVVSGTTTCADKDGNWTIDWSVGNDFGTPATVKKLKLDPKDLEVTGDVVEDGTEIPANSAGKPEDQVHGTTKVEDENVESVTIYVWLKWSDGYKTKWKEPAHYTVHKPEACGDETPPEQPQPGTPTPIVEADCDTLTLGLDNPKDGEDVTLTFKTSKGEARELEVKAGQKKTTKFSAAEGFFVEVGAEGVEGTTKVEYKQPEGCESGGGGGEEGPSLPVTGAAAGSIAGGAAALLIAGVVLFFVARRRKVRFTA